MITSGGILTVIWGIIALTDSSYLQPSANVGTSRHTWVGSCGHRRFRTCGIVFDLDRRIIWQVLRNHFGWPKRHLGARFWQGNTVFGALPICRDVSIICALVISSDGGSLAR